MHKLVDLGDGMELWMVGIDELREADVNAQVMAPAKFDQLVDNIRQRGALEQFPYCHLPADIAEPTHLDIISGHHRSRAARVAGLTEIPTIVDRTNMDRGEQVAKQIAHNALVGESDADVLRRMVAEISNPDQLLATGLDVDLLPTPKAADESILPAPAVPFTWRTIVFTFTPAQQDDFSELIDKVDKTGDLYGYASIEHYRKLIDALSTVRRERSIVSVGTAISYMVNAGLQRLAEDPQPDTATTPVVEVMGTGVIPDDIADQIRHKIDHAYETGLLTDTDSPWSLFV